MKKLVLSIIALVAMATASFAQYPRFVSYTPLNSRSITSNRSYNAPTISYSAPIRIPSTSYSTPRVSYNVSSTVNLNTTSVSGYTRSNGTYVQSHIRTMPNNTNWDNFSTKGNVNTYTGTTGYRARDYSSSAYNYGAGRIIQTGPRGGQYHNNSNGNKTYVPKRNLW